MYVSFATVGPGMLVIVLNGYTNKCIMYISDALCRVYVSKILF